MNIKIKLLASVAIISFSAPVYAQPVHDMHSMHNAVQMDKKVAKNKAVKAYISAMNKMHQGMMVEYTGNADLDFVKGMIPHHQGAIDMANIELKYGKDEAMRSLAKAIISAQEEEIGFMTNWLRGRDNGYKYPDAAKADSTIAFEKAMGEMHKDMMIKYSGNADVDFARGMIPHHQGAIDMAWILKEYGTSPELRPMIDDIIRSQSQEIEMMKQWLESNVK